MRDHLSPGAACPWKKLRNGVEIPGIGLGCAQLEDGGEQDALIARAVEAGYRLFDNALLYGNEALIGSALRRSGVKRESIFISSKLYGNLQGFDNTLRGFDRSVKDLQAGYLDLYLIHWPAEDPEVSRDTWRAMEKLYEDGLVRAIGVSNFMEKHLEEIYKTCNVPPMVSQLEFNPYHSSAGLRKYCSEHGMAVEGYFPLGGQVVGSRGIRKPPPEIPLFDNEVLKAIAAKHGKTVAQVILRWAFQSDVIVLPKTTKLKRLEENIGIFDFNLSQDEMVMIDGLNFNYSIGPGEGETNRLPTE